MKKNCRCAVFVFILACCVVPCITSQELPRPSGFVNDFAGVMTKRDTEAVNNLAAVVKEKTGAEMAVVTVKSFAPYATIDDFSLAIAEAWGVGEKGEDNGVLLVLAIDERKVKIEVGYGLEGAILDSTAGRILDTAVIPAFRKDDFSGGLTEGSRAIAAYIAKEKGVNLEEYDLPDTQETAGLQDTVETILLVIFIILIVLFRLIFGMRRSGRMYRSGSFGGGGSFSSSGRSFGSFRGFGGGSFGGGGSSRGF